MGTKNPTPRQDKVLDTPAVSRGPGAQMATQMHPEAWTSRLQSRSEAHLEVQDELQFRAVIREVAVYHSCKKPQAVPY